MNLSTRRALIAAALTGISFGSAEAANPPPLSAAPASSSIASGSAAAMEYLPLGTASFGPNGHGSYAWFIEVKTKQVVMCLVHNPQAPIECKRAPVPPN